MPSPRKNLTRPHSARVTVNILAQARDRLVYLADELGLGHARGNGVSRLLDCISLSEVVERENDLFGDPESILLRVRLRDDDPDAAL